MGLKTNGFIDVLQDQNDGNESLELFMKKIAKFDQLFCELMGTNVDFTIRLEVHGNKGKVLHARVYMDDIERPVSAGKNSK